MNCSLPFCQPAGRPRPGRARAFTLHELLLALAVVLVALAGLVTTHLYGLRMFEFIKPKLSAADEARRTVARLTEEIRSAHLIRVGQGSATNFTEVGVDTAQAGSAIQIYPTTNTSVFIRYFWDEAERCLKRLESGSGLVSTVAQSVSNSVIFTAEDFAGNVLTNNQNNRVIGMTLQFYQIQYPVLPIGPGCFFDFYQLRTKVTRRTLL